MGHNSGAPPPHLEKPVRRMEPQALNQRGALLSQLQKAQGVATKLQLQPDIK